MGLLVENLKVEGDKGKAEIACLFDTGSSETLIREDVAERIATIVELIHPIYFKMADGETPLEARKVVNLFITVNGCEILEPAIVVEKLSDEMIIGGETMQRRKIKLDLEKEKIIIDPRSARLRV
ncbi:MAG: retropepsin-like aspartic protease [bacterium]